MMLNPTITITRLIEHAPNTLSNIPRIAVEHAPSLFEEPFGTVSSLVICISIRAVLTFCDSIQYAGGGSDNDFCLNVNMIDTGVV